MPCSGRKKASLFIEGKRSLEAFTPVDINVQNEAHQIHILWADGKDSHIPIQRVRGYCPCAECQGHGTHVVWQENRVSQILDTKLVGQYAIHFQFSDGHHTGLFRFEHLRKLDPKEEVRWGKPEESLIRQG